ncbi:MAG TPA: 50S ribosomal protein L25 [Candidatus Margulisiibacteriota bacterium]|nr:50S ribosomal protein L25 [Candidatus Margulisiibacteriota bacterium]
MEEIFLEAEIREEVGRGKVGDLRQKGFIPAVVYAQGKEATPLKVGHKAFLGLVHQYRIESMIINLKIKDDKKNKPRACLVKEMQYDPVHGEIIHVDFNEISLTKAIKVNVPVVSKGEPAGVKQEGGSLEHILWEIEVECLPTDIPKNFEIDVTQLKIGDSIHIKDLSVPEKVKILNDPGAIVLSVAAPMKEEVPVEAVEGEEKQEPEVIKEKKEVAPEAEAEEGSKEAKEKK